MPISFPRTLHTFATALPNTTGENLDHLYVARVELTHRTLLPVREQWEELVQEQAAVGEVPLAPRAWRRQPSHPHHQIPTSFGRRLLTLPFWLYCRLRRGLFVPTQSLPNHHSHPPIGWPTALIHPHHTGICPPWGERPQRRHPRSQSTNTRTLTWPATPPWCKPRKVVGSWPAPRSSSSKAVQRYGAYFGKIQKAERGTGAGGSSMKEEDS